MRSPHRRRKKSSACAWFTVLIFVVWFLCRYIVAILLPEIVRHAFATLATSPPLVMGIR